MCFSAGASFGTGAVLTLIGVATIRKTENPSHRPFGLFPLVFALQQLIEGFVWLSLTNPFYKDWQSISGNAFLMFSHMVWPVWIPLSVLLFETVQRRRRIIYGLLATGIILALYHAFCLLFLPVASRIDGHHIQYLVDHPKSLLMPANIFYGLSTILPFFISSVRRMWWIGLFIMFSYLTTFIVYKDHIVSVWCFFATFISVFVYLIVARFQKTILLHKEA